MNVMDEQGMTLLEDLKTLNLDHFKHAVDLGGNILFILFTKILTIVTTTCLSVCYLIYCIINVITNKSNVTTSLAIISVSSEEWLLPGFAVMARWCVN